MNFPYRPSSPRSTDYYRVGKPVTHTDYPGQVGTVIAAQHSADRYLVRWPNGGTSYHIQGALRPCPVDSDGMPYTYVQAPFTAMGD
jgi:hypothetical protein